LYISLRLKLFRLIRNTGPQVNEPAIFKRRQVTPQSLFPIHPVGLHRVKAKYKSSPLWLNASHFASLAN
jgi:hypothetical protein